MPTKPISALFQSSGLPKFSPWYSYANCANLELASRSYNP
jgi:hypothetical protein